ncbi:MAG: hypothetical protein ACK5V3_01880, partial [Bdellovibrionales bacterium]
MRLVLLIFMISLCQISHGINDLKKINTNALISNAKILSIELKRQLDSHGDRVSSMEVFSGEGRFSGLFSSGYLDMKAIELMRDLEVYELVQTNLTDAYVDSLGDRIVSFSKEWISTVSGDWSIPSERINKSTKFVFDELKIIVKRSESPETLASIQKIVKEFKSVLLELGSRSLSVNDQVEYDRLLRNAKQTWIITSSFNFTNIKLFDFFNRSGSSIIIDGFDYRDIFSNRK